MWVFIMLECIIDAIEWWFDLSAFVHIWVYWRSLVLKEYMIWGCEVQLYTFKYIKLIWGEEAMI